MEHLDANLRNNSRGCGEYSTLWPGQRASGRPTGTIIAVLIDLVAFMIDLIAFLIDLMDLFDQEAVVLVNGLMDVRHWANTWMSTRFFDLRWDGECALNPAVSVHDICN